ncbi:sulfatase-like hydrolase/transferase [Bradyrhizobium paxllaeri]|uniref:sulfatase-like hydrolase/transferase n=1 Tax=Bradyrhizobium paxllaeri TaxID=190148 RepID=UPI0008105B66|nr:sulfatase-like hydrolase/transferase [Bradyrhizobium paxllaeri]
MNVMATESAVPARAQNAFLLHLALSAIAIAQPFYSVTGKTLNFFVAWRMSSVEFTFCILLIYIVPPVVTWLLVELGNRLHRNLGSALLFVVLCFYISLTLLMAARQLVHSLPFATRPEVPLWMFALLLILSAGLAALLFAKPKVQGFVRFFAVATVIFPVTVLLHARDLGVIQFSEVPPAEKIETADRPNVILIIYDELPLTTILDANGLIDRNKFPNFYQFAQGATWLPNARSTSGHTEAAVPSILAGQVRENGVPATYKSYPENIFHRLGPSYNVLDLQSATDLNPVKQLGETTDSRDDNNRHRKIARDVAIILAHVLAPRQLTARLPSVGTRHNRFGEDAFKSWRGARHHDAFVAALAHVEKPFLAIYHNIYPHNGWNNYPSGRPYPSSRWGEYLSLADHEDTRLGQDNARLLHDYKAHLLQSMHADKLFGELLAQLKKNGQYDHSIIAFVADHGLSLWPGERPRNPSEAHQSDVFAIPMIVKLPGQTDGRVTLEPVYTTDIYPTILDYLGVSIPERLQGKSFVKSIRDAATADTVKSTQHRDDPTLKRRLEWFGAGTSMADLYGLGKFRGYMGRNINEFELIAMPEARVHLIGTSIDIAGPRLSARIDARIQGGAQDGKPWDILIALGGRICGATQTTDLAVSGKANSFTLVVAEECLGLLRKGVRVFAIGSDERLAEISVHSEQPTTPPPTIDQILEKLAELIDTLQRTAEDVQGQADLQALSQGKIAVPGLFVREQQLATPWGEVVLTRDGRRWLIDLYSVPREMCKAIHLHADKVPGVIRIAASGAARDETDIPVTAEGAEFACSNPDSEMIRIIASDAPARGAASAPPPATGRLLAQLAELIDGLDKVTENSQGQVTLEALRKLGVAVPAIFIRDRQLAWPWGEAAVTRGKREWILDLHSAPADVCRAIHLGADEIPGAARIATSGFANDEATIPVTAAQADAACSSIKSNVRLIVNDKSIANLARETVAAPWRRLKRAVSGQ